MRTARKIPAALLTATPRLELLQGGRTASDLTTAPAAQGLHLVTADTVFAAVPPADSFAQARRIVAQVEREIAQRVSRESDQRHRLLPRPAFALALPVRAQAVGFGRLRRFFGL